MRGKRRFLADAGEKTRITPADAGKTAPECQYPKQLEDHPRGCGENQSLLLIHEHRVGSPPRMRGKLFEGVSLLYVPRITPADAGKTHAGWGDNLFDKDHPRGCGENCLHLNSPTTILGSPPRMRGKPESTALIALLTGITPADAGKTRRSGRRSAKQGDHPRGCGENRMG